MHDDFDTFDKAEAETKPAQMQTIIDPRVGIDIRQRRAGEIILIEAEDDIYELIVVDPARQYIQVTASDRRLHCPAVGMLVYSYNALDRKDRRDAWIGYGRRLVISFANAIHETGVVLSASVRGESWHLDVF